MDTLQDGYTALHHAADKGHKEAVRELLLELDPENKTSATHGSNPNGRPDDPLPLPVPDETCTHNCESGQACNNPIPRFTEKISGNSSPSSTCTALCTYDIHHKTLQYLCREHSVLIMDDGPDFFHYVDKKLNSIFRLDENDILCLKCMVRLRLSYLNRTGIDSDSD
jgi:hypothetical protein